MSKAALSLLNTIGLLSKNAVADLNSFDDDALRKLLHYYYDQRSRTANAELDKLSKDQTLSSLVSSFSAKNAVLPLLPSFLIHGHLITDDPLFRICVPESEMGAAQKQAMGMTVNDEPDRVVITNKLAYFSISPR